jgi:hypothetical protein
VIPEGGVWQGAISRPQSGKMFCHWDRGWDSLAGSVFSLWKKAQKKAIITGILSSPETPVILHLLETFYS